MASRETRFSIKLMTLAVAVFFMASGLLSIINYDSAANQIARGISNFFGQQNYTVTLIIAIAELVTGLILLIDFFLPLNETALSLVKLIILVAWVLYIVYTHFTSGVFKPDFFSWLQPFSQDLVILSTLWVIRSK